MAITVVAPSTKSKLSSLGFAALFFLNLSLIIGSILFIGVFAIMLVPMAADPSSPFLIQTAVKLVFIIPLVATLGLLVCIVGLFAGSRVLQVAAIIPFLYSQLAFVALLASFGIMLAFPWL